MGFLLDIEDGAELRHSVADTTIVRVAHVDGLEGSDLDAMLWDALDVLAQLGTTDPPLTDIELGSAHPTIPLIVVTNFNVVPVRGCAQATIEITYSLPRVDIPPGGGDGADHKTIRYQSQGVQTTRDPLAADPEAAAASLFVDAPSNATTDYSIRPGQIKTVSILEARAVLTFQRSEEFIPTARMRTYQNTVNDADLPVISPKYDQGTLYCNTIQADTVDQGGLYLVRYEFIWNPKGHSVEYKWEAAGLDIEEYDTDSRKLLSPYAETDFTLLGLDFSD